MQANFVVLFSAGHLNPRHVALVHMNVLRRSTYVPEAANVSNIEFSSLLPWSVVTDILRYWAVPRPPVLIRLVRGISSSRASRSAERSRIHWYVYSPWTFYLKKVAEYRLENLIWNYDRHRPVRVILWDGTIEQMTVFSPVNVGIYCWQIHA